MRHLALLSACLVYGSLLFSQSISQAADSTRKVVAKSVDSALMAKGSALKQSKDTAIKQYRRNLTSGAKGLQKDLTSQVDSQARASYKQEANKEISGLKSRVSSLPKRAYKGIKSQLPEGTKLIKFSLQLRSESFATNAQNPMIRSELAYSRLYLSPTFTLLGLPFTSNLFFTTESNNTYKNNFFAFRLDVQALRRMAEEQMRKDIEETKKLDRMRQVDLNKNAMESKRYQRELDQLKKQVPDYDNWEKSLGEEAERQCSAQIDKERALMEEKYKNAGEKEKMRLQEDYERKCDSLKHAARRQINDSMTSVRDSLGTKVDTSRLNRILALQQKLGQLETARKNIDRMRQMDTAGLSGKISDYKDPDKMKKMGQDKLQGKGLLGKFLSVDRLGIGLIAPAYSEFTLFAASVKGLDIGVSKEHWFYDLSLGRMSRQFMGPFSSVNPEFDRNVGEIRIGLGSRDKDFVSIEYMNAFDPKYKDSLTPKVRNGVFDLGFRYTLMNMLTLEGDLAQSTYRESYLSLNQINYGGGNPNKSMNDNASRAFRLKAIQSIGQNTKLTAEARQVGAAFRSLGNPFLRRNFREIDAKAEQSLWKKRIRIEASYKEMRDNLVEINSSTNRLKGWGVKLQTAFEKLPNIILSHSPYQQGNNHPDSLYRTNNQFSITTAMITYRKRFKGFNWSSLASYTRSAMEISGRGAVSYTMYSATQNVQIGNRQNVLLTYMSNVTAPFVDSLNSNSWQMNYSYLAKKGLSLGLLGEYTRYKNEALKAGLGLTVNMAVLRNLSVSLLARYDRVDGLWRLEDENVWSGRMVLNWRW